jgi:GntR family transcriptional regulator
MKIRIDKGSDVSVHRQLAEQIVFLIASGALKPGDELPSVRATARRHKIHPNTVSQAYRDLVERNWIKGQRGKKMTVRSLDEPLASHAQDLDDLIDAVVRNAYERGYTMQDLRKRMMERLLIEPPDHVLVVENEAGMQQLLFHELKESMPIRITACSPERLSGNPGHAIGALVVSLPGRVREVASLLPPERKVFGLAPSSIDPHVERIKQLRDPSLIVVVSISEVFLEFAGNLLAPFAGDRHTIELQCMGSDARDLSGADPVFCDSLCRPKLHVPRLVHYRLVSAQSVHEIAKLVSSSARPKSGRKLLPPRRLS